MKATDYYHHGTPLTKVDSETTANSVLEQYEVDCLEKNIVTFQNAIMYRDYRIYHSDNSWVEKWSFVHENYDGAEDAHDHRYGDAKTIEECIVSINEQIKDNEV